MVIALDHTRSGGGGGGGLIHLVSFKLVSTQSVEADGDKCVNFHSYLSAVSISW